MPAGKLYPISEIFGPTIQGEGPLAGTRTFFVRFAGCDFDCLWCDTKYAIRPSYPGWTKEMMTIGDINDKLYSLGAVPAGAKNRQEWVTLSGGNPALFVDSQFEATMSMHYRLAMETQGSSLINLPTLAKIDCLVISPKPPSSGMANRFDKADIIQILDKRWTTQITALKYVIFNEDDLEWVADVDRMVGAAPWVRRYLSVGTPLDLMGVDPMNNDGPIIVGFRQLAEIVKTDPRFKHFIASLQQHVLLWGQKRGV